jgi:hypothetical protein
MNIPATLPDNVRAALELLPGAGSTPWEVGWSTLERYLLDRPAERPLIEALRPDEAEDLLAEMIAAARVGQAEDSKHCLEAYLSIHRFALEYRVRPALDSLEQVVEPVLAAEREPLGVEVSR